MGLESPKGQRKFGIDGEYAAALLNFGDVAPDSDLILSSVSPRTGCANNLMSMSLASCDSTAFIPNRSATAVPQAFSVAVTPPSPPTSVCSAKAASSEVITTPNQQIQRGSIAKA